MHPSKADILPPRTRADYTPVKAPQTQTDDTLHRPKKSTSPSEICPFNGVDSVEKCKKGPLVDKGFSSGLIIPPKCSYRGINI